MTKLAIIVAALAVSRAAFAAGIDSRTYTCPELQAFILERSFVFINNPDFEDFVVANGSFCSGGQRVQVRSVGTRDDPECLVNYCIPVNGPGSG